MIICSHFRGISGREAIATIDCEGDLFHQFHQAEDFILSRLSRSYIIKSARRSELLEIPQIAIREALLNAIIHKDYSGNAPIQISVYKDKIMLWNDGQLPENWTIETLTKKHSSKPYNPDIANAVFRCGYIESWGRGTIKIIEKCKEAGLPTPSYYYESSGFWVEFRKDIYSESYLQSLNLNDRQIKAILYTKDNEKITNSTYQEINDCSRNTASNDLSELVEKELLKPSGQKGAGAFYSLK